MTSDRSSFEASLHSNILVARDNGIHVKSLLADLSVKQGRF